MKDPYDLAAELLQKNWNKLGKFAKLCIYQSTRKGDYDASTGVKDEPSIEFEKSLSIVFDDFSFSKTSASYTQSKNVEIKARDRMAIFPFLDLQFPPKINDRIVDHKGRTWKVVGGTEDPGPVHYELHVRPEEWVR